MHDELGYGEVSRFGADGIDLPVHFLNEKIHGSAAGAWVLQKVTELVEVTLNPGDLFGHVELVGENDYFPQDAFLCVGDI